MAIARQRMALDPPTPKRAAAARRDAPPVTAATTCSRKSTERAFDISVGLLADRQLESNFARVGEDHSSHSDRRPLQNI
jgi:hypothetical protein